MFTLNPSSSVPIYQQIVNQCRKLVAGGQLKPGDKLPSVRMIATDLGINPMTVSKAYSLLDQTGVVVRQRGLGMVVAESGPMRAQIATTESKVLITYAKEVGMTRSELVGQIERLWEET
ncbi:MAG: GntR family transcriptional regulator [Gammaproteobacteria bacterium]|nr:GntR family transcriptional regulator [Gammaproteobacteria bacterium]